MTVAKVSAAVPYDERHLFWCQPHPLRPGAFAPGLASKISGGEYDPAVPEFLSATFADAIIEAYKSMKPAQIAHGVIDAPQFIRNRTRDAAVDSFLNYMVVEQEGGRRCYVTRWSAHPTIFGTDMMEFSAEYPGEMTRYIEQKTNASTVYLGGGLGSMSPRAPEAATPSERVTAYGQLLGQLVLDNTQNLEFINYADVDSVRVRVGVPAPQARPLSPKWRLSPVAARILGVPRKAGSKRAHRGYGLHRHAL